MGGPLTIGEILRRSTAYLAERGSPSPRLDADLLLAHVLGVERLALYTDSERPLTPAELGRARELLARRGRREPMAYITGARAFRRLRLAVGPAVLVPRPETELLVEWALEAAPAGGAALDWGTGSGAVALALADEGDGLRVTALDRSGEALALARANGEALGLEVEWLRSDGFAALDGRRFDVIVANPPYLSDADLAAAPPELGFEPRGALVAGPTGLEQIDAIAGAAPRHLAPGGLLLVEVGDGQAGAARAALAGAGLVDVAARDDLAGVARVVGGRAL
ncbi:peptide chain release factor N(5)-glutamine methyltransferase [Miltoncostaea marina]|uniref:peptide chain release factor N(5)-glutamine methyltransferase n=1 Tax=Miltoncostaea marina TaxID=2843215 RepID=UPI001C3CED27|nr:peptide chain release factor N(5)-glutamine methyltransferase [Miltoncostaea marina]